jgi:hypothetical protein
LSHARTVANRCTSVIVRVDDAKIVLWDDVQSRL